MRRVFGMTTARGAWGRDSGGAALVRPLVWAALGSLLAACASLTPAPRSGAQASQGVAGEGASTSTETSAEGSAQAAGTVDSASQLRRAPVSGTNGHAASPASPAPGPAGSPRQEASGDSPGSDISLADISSEATRVFGDSTVSRPATDAAAPLAGPVWDIDVHSYETHARVVYFVNVFSTKVRAAFAKSLQRQTRYGPMLRQKLREGGLPEDMIYLALIESWYDPNAYSSAAAVGMWQFMTRTARGAGLRVDWWVDERRDPVRSTEAAVRHLKSLREEFGSMYLAAAAYNGGGGRVSRGLTQYAGDFDGVEGDDRFFALSDTKYLRQQTRDYVPKLIAAALVGKEPARYGVPVESLPPFAFDTVEVPAATPLAAIADASGSTVADLRELNPHLIRGMTPPNAVTWVRVPPAGSVNFADRFAALEPEQRAAVKRVESKKGESMRSIAKKNSMSSVQLGWYNPKVARLKSGNLRAGQVILIPSRATYQAAAKVPDPSIERYPRRAPARKASAAKSKVRKAVANKPKAGKAAAAKPRATKAAAKPKAGKAAAAKPKAGKAAAAKPKAGKAAAAKPGVTAPKALAAKPKKPA